ncbi:MAG: zinc-ribbon domain-containing protein [Myxococcota bacterium]
MIVECPSCSTRFNLDESRIGDRGAKVRCSVCSHSFVVHASSPLPDEITAVDPRAMGDDFPASLDPGSDTVTDAHAAPQSIPTNRYDFTPFLSGGPQPMKDLQPTVPGGPELVEGDDIIEIGADEVDELAGYTSTRDYPAPGQELDAASQPQTSVDPAEFLDIEEPSNPGGYYATPDSMMTVNTAPGAFAVTSDEIVDPFAPAPALPPEAPPPSPAPPARAADGDFIVETKPHSNPLLAAAGQGLSVEHFESHSTAVFNVAQLAQSPEASPDALGLDADVPGGLGPSNDDSVPGQGLARSTTVTLGLAAASSGVRNAVSFLVTATMLLGLVAGSVFMLVYTGRLDPQEIGLGEVLATPHEEPVGGFENVYPLKVRSVLYPSRLGAELLVFVGEVENRGAVKGEDLDVVARLVDTEGSVVASATAPIGVVFDVGELADVVDRRDVDGLIRKKLADGLGGPIGAGERRDFMVVLPSPPSRVSVLSHQVVVVPRPKALPGEAAVLPSPLEPLDEVDAKPVGPGKRKRKARRAKRARAE